MINLVTARQSVRLLVDVAVAAGKASHRYGIATLPTEVLVLVDSINGALLRLGGAASVGVWIRTETGQASALRLSLGMLTFRQIEVFTAVMRAGSLIGAARDLRISQPTVTRMILRIEDQLGMALFDRVKGRILPTPEAARFLAEVDRAFEQMRGAIDRAALASRSGRSLFRLGASPSLGRGLVPNCVTQLAASDPRLSVRLDVLSVSQVLGYLVDQQGDVAVTLYPILHHDVRSVQVGFGRPLLVVPLYPEFESVGNLADLATLKPSWLLFEPRSMHGEMLAGILADAGFHPAWGHLVRFAESAIALAEAGMGVTIVDEFSARAADRSRVRLLEIETPRRFTVHFHRSLGQGVGGFAEEFETLLRAELGEIDSRRL